MQDVVLGVVGASGGLGVSTLAVALTIRAGDRYGAATAVDGDLLRGGVDVTACVEHQPGVRWGDLRGLEGEVDAPGLLRSLPSERNARFLAAGGGEPSAPVVRRVLSALAVSSSVLVVDAATRSDAVPAGADVVLVSGTSVRHLADAAAVAALLSCDGARVGLVLRVAGRGGVDPEDVAYHLDLPLLAVLRDDSRVATDPGRGRPPGTRGSDAVGTVADRVLDSVVGDGAAGMDGTAGARAAWAEGGPVTVRASRRGVA